MTNPDVYASIPHNTRRAGLATAICGGCVILFGALVVKGTMSATDAMFDYLLGGFGLLFFGSLTASGLSRVFGNKPALEFTAEHFVNRSSLGAIPRVAWSEIAGAEIVPWQVGRVLVIRLHDPKAVLARQKPLVRSTQRMNMSTFGSPAVVTPSLIGATLEDVLAQVLSRVAEPAAERKTA
ncbi:MAG: STM3941 family protein [Fimbriimonadales bacterium]